MLIYGVFVRFCNAFRICGTENAGDRLVCPIDMEYGDGTGASAEVLDLERRVCAFRIGKETIAGRRTGTVTAEDPSVGKGKRS